MTAQWTPTWLEVAGVLVFLAVALVHTGHALRMSGRARLWHCAHVLMALGMIDMYWPSSYWPSSMPVGEHAGEAVFAVATIALAVFSAFDAQRRHPPLWLALITGVDLLAMVYMFAMMSHTAALLSVIGVAWFALEAVAWLTGELSTVAWRSGLGLSVRKPAPIPELEVVRVGARGRAPSPVAVGAMPVAEHVDPVFGRPLRLTLALMSVGMGYMLLAMQWGGQTMPGMPGGPSMQMSPSSSAHSSRLISHGAASDSNTKGGR